MNILTVTNPCTLVKTSVKADAILFTGLKKDILDNGIDNFLSGNYKKFSYGVSSSYFYDYEFLNNSFEVSIGNIDIEYDITKLDSNIANNDNGTILKSSIANTDVSGNIVDLVSEYKYPVCFNFPSGHIDDNRAMVLGKTVKLEINNNKVELKYQ